MNSQKNFSYAQASRQSQNDAYYENENPYPDYGNYEITYENGDLHRQEAEEEASNDDTLVEPTHNSISNNENPQEDQNNYKPIDYKTQLEIDDYNLNIQSHTTLIKHLIMRKSNYDFEMRDLKKRLSQSEERYVCKTKQLSEMTLLYEQSQNDIRQEKEKRSDVLMDCETLQTNTDYLTKQVSEMEKILPELQNYVQQLCIKNNKLQKNLCSNNKQLAAERAQYKSDLDAYKALLEEANKKELILSENVNALNMVSTKLSDQISDMRQQYNEFEEKYEEALKTQDVYKNSIAKYETDVSQLMNDNKILREKYEDVLEKHRQEKKHSEEIKFVNNELIEKMNELLKKSEEINDENLKLKSDLITAEMNLEKAIQEYKEKSDSDQSAIKDMANHLDLCKAECEQKIKVEQAFAAKQNAELYNEIENLKEKRRSEINDKDLEIDAKNRKLAEYESLVSDLNRNLSNVSQRLETKSTENMKLLQELLQNKTTIKSLTDAKNQMIEQIQRKSKQIEMLKTAHRLKNDKTAYVAPAKVETAATKSLQYESDSSADARVVQVFYDENNTKRRRIITKRELRRQSAISQFSEQPTQKLKPPENMTKNTETKLD